MNITEWDKNAYYVEGDFVSFNNCNYVYYYRPISIIKESSINQQPCNNSHHWIYLLDAHIKLEELKVKYQEKLDLIQKLEKRIHDQNMPEPVAKLLNTGLNLKHIIKSRFGLKRR